MLPTTMTGGDPVFEELFYREYLNLVRYAEIILSKHGASHVSVSGRAEDVVQEVFCLAWERKEEVLNMDAPKGWLCKTVMLKVREALRDDRTWVKRLSLVAETPRSGMRRGMPEEWVGLMSEEDYDLLKKLYLEGYSYQELCDGLGVKKSALAMRVRRIKERFQKNFENF